MNDYIIVTDSSADLSTELVQEAGVEVLPLRFTIEGQTKYNWPDNREMDPKEFYSRLRGGRNGHHRRGKYGPISDHAGACASGGEGCSGAGVLLRLVGHL